MKKQLTVVGLRILILVLLVFNVRLAYAHDWWYYCWHGGTPTSITLNWNHWGSYPNEAQAAINDWDASTKVNFIKSSANTKLYVIGSNYGATGWWGLTDFYSSEPSFAPVYDWWHHSRYCKIQFGRSRYNSHYGGTAGTGTTSDIRGIYCHEIGHALGLDHHSAYNDCTGKPTYNKSNVTTAHVRNNVNAKNFK